MNVTELINETLKEDIQGIDITSSLLIDPSDTVNAHIIAKEAGVFFGGPIIETMNKRLDLVDVKSIANDGQPVNPGDGCVTLTGNLKQIIEAERTLLNFLQRLSGIATVTNQFVQALNDPSIQVLDTRKTTPLFRELEKAAVVAGGGFNHRFGLFDMVLVKENHLNLYLKHSELSEFNNRLRQQKINQPEIHIEVEVSNIDLLTQLDLTAIDIILFDNMDLNHLNKCLDYLSSQSSNILKEVSGNVSLDTINRYKGIDIDRISVGSLTHSVKALDLSLLVL